MTRRSDRSRAEAFLLAALLLGLPSACSVKEDRAECPVYVTVLTDRFLQRGLDTGTLSFAAARPIGRETIGFLSYILYQKFYKLDEKRYDEILREIEARKRADGSEEMS